MVTILCRGQIFSGPESVKECHFLPYSSILDGVPEKKYNPLKRPSLIVSNFATVTSVMKPYLEAICWIGCSCEVTWILYGFRSGGVIVTGSKARKFGTGISCWKRVFSGTGAILHCKSHHTNSKTALITDSTRIGFSAGASKPAG